MSDWPRRLSILLIVFVLGLCVYRARTQSFTIDEAWTYNLFVGPPLSKMAQQYDACNHVLHTILMKAARAFFGGGELALRLPSLLAALLYCIAAYRLTSLLLGRWMQLLAMVLLTLTPVMLDFLIAARGYGLAVALFLWTLYSAVCYVTRGFELKWLRRAGILAGLSIAANLVMIIPAAALGFALLMIALRDGAQAMWRVVDSYGGPAVTAAFLILIIPVLPAASKDFYYGATSVPDSLRSLADGFLKTERRWPGKYSETFDAIVGMFLMPMLLSLFALAAIRLIPRYVRSQPAAFRMAPQILLATTSVASAAAILVLHAAAGVKYPLGRTGLYLLPLWMLTTFYGLRLLDGDVWKWVRAAGTVVLAVLAFIAVRQTDNRYFAEWRYDAGTLRLMRALEADMKGRHWDRSVRVGTDDLLRETTRWYRNRRRLEWMDEPVSNNVETAPFDYYFLTSGNAGLVSKLNLQVVSLDPVAGSVLARPRQ